jgi:hypothetical protein
MQQRRLKNVMSLEFATVSNMDMHNTMKDSSAMVRVSYTIPRTPQLTSC